MTNVKKVLGLLGVSAIAVAGWCAPAVAAEDQPAAQVATPPAAAEQGGMQDIVVTARRRTEAAQTVPQSIAVFNQQTLTQAHIQSTLDINKAVPGLNADAGNGNSSNIYFAIRGRGFNYGAATGSVETYFADIPLSSPFQMPQLPPELFDLQSFQVLKGPQGTLFGRNTTGGAVVLVPQAPTDRFEGYLRLQGGTYGDFQAEGAINIPLGEKAALRVSGFDWQRQGYQHNIFNGPDPVTGKPITPYRFQNKDVQQIRASLRVNLTDTLKNTTIATYSRDASIGGEVAGLNAIAGPSNGLGAHESPYYLSRTQALETDYTLRKPTEVWAVINTTTFDVTSAVTLKNIFGYISGRGVGNAPTSVFANSLVTFDILVPPRVNKNEQFTDELQLQGKSFDNRLDWTVGGMYDRTKEPTDPNSINYQTYAAQQDQIQTNFGATNIKSFGLYASATYKFSTKLDLTAGYRHTWDDLVTSGSFQSAPTFVDTCPTTPLTVSVPNCEVKTPPYSIHQKFQGNAVNVTVAYHPDRNAMIYAGYRLGYKRGGIAASIGNPFNAETINDFTVGFKSEKRIAGMKTRFNVEGFYDLLKDQQISYYAFTPQTNAISAITTNVPKTTYRGFDVDLTMDVTPWATLSANYTFLDTFYTKFPDFTAPPGTTPADLSVNPVAFAPRNKFSVGVRLHEDLPGDAGEIAIAPRVTYQSREYSSPTGLLQPVGAFGANGCILHGACYVPNYALVDLRAEWNHVMGSRVNAALNVTNLTDKFYFTGESGLYPFGLSAYGYGEPRMVNFEVGLKF